MRVCAGWVCVLRLCLPRGGAGLHFFLSSCSRCGGGNDGERNDLWEAMLAVMNEWLSDSYVKRENDIVCMIMLLG